MGRSGSMPCGLGKRNKVSFPKAPNSWEIAELQASVASRCKKKTLDISGGHVWTVRYSSHGATQYIYGD
ncbi:hypothetical protein AAHA92_10853 [Salvia divinorum]|uniref:Uncharacterized protein n=1 Tax=Salvia divinorum TaxID=28513 RepID=A0ABD1I038_SALDI